MSFWSAPATVDGSTLQESGGTISIKSPHRRQDHFDNAPSGDLVAAATRAFGTSYQATAGKARFIVVAYHGSQAGTEFAELREDATDAPPATAVSRGTTSATSAVLCVLVGIVRPGYYYRVVDVLSTLILDYWYEIDL